MTGHGFIYPNVIEEICVACSNHIAGKSSADELQRMVQRAENEIAAIEENDVRAKLTEVEGRLELIRFTVETDKQHLETVSVARDLIGWLDRRNAKNTSG